MVEWLRKTDIRTKNSDETRIWEENLQIILSQQDLIDVFYYKNKSKRLEHSILGALINNLQKDDLKEQIQLCMKLNQIELAKERISGSSKHIEPQDAHDLFLEALLGNRVEFAKLLLDHSYVNIQNFMTNERLKDLYVRGVEQDFLIPGGKSFFYQICSRKIPFSGIKLGDDEERLQEWKNHLEGLTVNKKKDGAYQPIPLWAKIAYCEKKLIDSDWSSIYIRKLRLTSTLSEYNESTQSPRHI